MRRSQAPSQVGANKKPKIDYGTSRSPGIGIKPAATQKSNHVTTGIKSSQDVLKLFDTNNRNDEEPENSHQQPPANKYNAKTVFSEKNVPVTPASACGETVKYFSVFWCKASAKKHKNWEEDAVLVVKARAVTLKNMEGKAIGQASGFKLAELENLDSGSILKVGGREVLIQDVISESSYLSGSCFSQLASASAPPAGGKKDMKNEMPSQSASKPKQVNRNFVTPFLKDGGNLPKANIIKEIKPKHNPNAPTAVVMPRPPLHIQMKDTGVVIVDVVVDPLLSKSLRPHQREGVIFLYECVMGFKVDNMYGAILADEMGLGKTLQCITLIWTLLHQGPYNGRPVISRILIVTPSSLVKNWDKEFRRWLGRERINVFTANQNNRAIEFLKMPLYPVMVISYDMLIRCFDEIQQCNFDLVICDEGHRLKNQSNKTSSFLAQLDTNRKILVSGTPVQNDLKEFYTLADFVNPGILGNPSSFRRIFEEPILALQQPECDEDQRFIGEDCAKQLADLTSQFVLRRTQEVMSAHLPPKVESVIFCKPSSLQVKMYGALLGSTAVRTFLSSHLAARDQLSFILALRKLCNHPSFFSGSDQFNQESDLTDDFDPDAPCPQELLNVLSDEEKQAEAQSGKFLVTFALVDSLLKNTKEKILLVSYSTKMLDLFEISCKEQQYDFLRLDGSTQTDSRMSLVDRFNDPTGRQRIFLLSAKAGGVGLNLIGASRLILYDIDWNPANDLQAMARIWRDGQKKRVHIYRLLTTGTIEEKIFQRQILKQGLSGAVVDARDNTQGHFTKEELKDLFTLREDTNCDTHDLIGCNCTKREESLKLKLGDLDDYDFDNEDSREYQQETITKAKELHKTVDQLMDWQHYGPPFPPGIFDDTCLEATLKYVTFVFRCVSGFTPSPSET